MKHKPPTTTKGVYSKEALLFYSNQLIPHMLRGGRFSTALENQAGVSSLHSPHAEGWHAKHDGVSSSDTLIKCSSSEAETNSLCTTSVQPYSPLGVQSSAMLVVKPQRGDITIAP